MIIKKTMTETREVEICDLCHEDFFERPGWSKKDKRRGFFRSCFNGKYKEVIAHDDCLEKLIRENKGIYVKEERS